MAVEDLDAMSLMPLETPVLKVSRPVAACSRCRNAKIKCDGKLPACSSCEKNGRAAECTSTNDQFARGKERSYVSTLETRIDRLQQKLEEAQARKPSVISIPDDDTAVPSRRQSQAGPDAQEPPTPNTSRRFKRREVSAIDDLVSDFGFLSVNATARDFYGFTSAMSYARLILSACTKDELPQGTTKTLPPRHVAIALTQHYLSNIFILLPMFDEASLYASVDNVYSRDYRKADPLDHWMVRMVLAIASASMSEQRGDQHYMEGIGHICAALEDAESVLHPGNISGVQALILLTQYAMLDPHHFDSWSLIGAASRAMTDLGLHQDPPKGAPMTKYKLELRRRVFHCVYALDRSTSLVQTRAFSFSDDSAKVKIPFHKQPNSAPSSPQPGVGSQPKWLQSNDQALDMIRLRQIQSVWYTDLFQSGRTRWEDPYTYLWDTCDSMRRWFENISPSTPPNLRAFFELDLLYSYVYVLSPSPRVPVILPFAQKLIFEYSIRYAQLMLQLITDPTYNAPLTFYDAMRVYMTGRQFLDVLQHNTELLLNGFIPPHPEVKPSAAAPPPMPVVPLPPGETVLRFSTVRSINCIKNITECLARFGLRWGYMSWNQRFQNETSSMLEQLNERLREVDQINGVRKQSVWQQGPIGSMPSSNGSFTYGSPSQPVPQGANAYQSMPVQMQPNQNLGENGQPQSSPPHVTSSQGFDLSGMLPQTSPSQYPTQQGYTQEQAPQPRAQPFNFNDHTHHQTSSSIGGNHFFSGWVGYDGPIVENVLDEENADPCATSVLQQVPNQRQRSPSCPQLGYNFPPRQRREVPDLRMLDLSTACRTQMEPAQGLSIASGQHIPRSYSIPTFYTAIIPQSRASSQTYIISQNRRVSMHDAAVDLLQCTYPPTQAIVQRSAANEITSHNRRDKGKGKAKEDGFASMRQGPSIFYPPLTDRRLHGVLRKQDFGFTCIICGSSGVNGDLHRPSADGKGCVDPGSAEMGNMAIPWKRDLPPAPPTPRLGNAVLPDSRHHMPPPMVNAMRTHVAAGPIVHAPDDGPGGGPESVDLGLHPVGTNDSLLTSDAAPVPIEDLAVMGEQQGGPTVYDMLQSWMLADYARKMSENSGLFF